MSTEIMLDPAFDLDGTVTPYMEFRTVGFTLSEASIRHLYVSLLSIEEAIKANANDIAAANKLDLDLLEGPDLTIDGNEFDSVMYWCSEASYSLSFRGVRFEANQQDARTMMQLIRSTYPEFNALKPEAIKEPVTLDFLNDVCDDTDQLTVH